MKNKIILTLISILCLPLVYSLYGGNKEIIFDGECAELIVNVSISPLQDEGEYDLEPNCNIIKELEHNYKIFKCICEGNRTMLTLTPKVNSFGNYTFKIKQYKQIDNETTESIKYNITNPSSKNMTTTILLPNNITIERVLEPNESLVYVETKENYIIIPEANVSFVSIITDDNNINLVCVSSGVKCFDIYSEKGKPYLISINGTSVSFTYNDTTKLINFCTSFSTKSISVTWIYPLQEQGSVSGSGGGRGGGVFTVRFQENKPTTLMLQLNKISRFWVNGIQHIIRVTRIGEDYINLEIESSKINLSIKLNQTEKIDFEQDGYYDLKITLKEIIWVNMAFIEFEKIHLLYVDISEEQEESIEKEKEATGICETCLVNETIKKEETEAQPESTKQKDLYLLTMILILIFVIIGLGIYIYISYKKNFNKKEE